jgi:excisionase family DNA binding protein
MLTYKDIADRWNVKVSDVQRLVYSGKLRRLKLSHKKVRFRPSDVEAYERKVLR